MSIAKLEIPKTVLSDIHSCINAVAPDMGECTNDELLETALDADRVFMYGSKESGTWLSTAFKEHGYNVIFKTLKKTGQFKYV